MRHRSGRLLASLAAAAAMAVLTMLPGFSVPVVQAAGAADAEASAVVKLINGERAYHGQSALSVDSYLASKARDGAVWCPNDSSKVMDGRAKDMAVSGYFSHALRLCTSYTIIDALATWGYTGGRGEIIAANSLGTGSVGYRYGCTPSVSACPGSSANAPQTAADAVSWWVRSSVHYSIITGSYNRIGCGAWLSTGGEYYYSCLFALNGSPVVTPKPRVTPRPNGTPRPGTGGDPVEPGSVASVTQAPTQAPPWPTPSGARGWLVMPVVVAQAGIDPAGNSPSQGSSAGRARDATGGLPPVAEVALAGMGVAWTLVMVWLRLGPRRRYRPRGGGVAPPV